jgi:hypothetical protein
MADARKALLKVIVYVVPKARVTFLACKNPRISQKPRGLFVIVFFQLADYQYLSR